MPSGGHNRKRPKEMALDARRRADRMWTEGASREALLELLDEFVEISRMAYAEVASEQATTIVNSGDQVQKHPAVSVLEICSKQIQSLVIQVERFAEVGGESSASDGPPPAWTPKAVKGGKS